MKKNGFVLGKFMPPHIGHLALLRFAKEHCEHLTVLVESRLDEPMSASIRAQWIHEALYGDPHIRVVALEGEHPQAPPLVNPEPFWEHWHDIIQQYCPNLDVLISSEDYGKKLALDQGVEWISLDRTIIPTSGTMVRDNPWERWWDLIEPARRCLVKRVVVMGPESTGKSVLSQHLANLSPTVSVPEYAADWIARNPDRTLGETELRHFFKSQMALVHAYASQANRWLVEDSHPVTTSVWAEYLGFHQLRKEIDDWCQTQTPPDLILLTHPQGSIWVEDVHRKQQTDQDWFFNAFEERLQHLKWNYTIIQGNWQNRTRQAEDVVLKSIQQWKTQPLAIWMEKTPQTNPHLPSKPSIKTSI